jgi:hypothetical protein
MTRPEHDWSDLTDAWTGSPEPEPPVDAGLIRALRRRDRLAKINFLLEMAGGAGGLVATGWAMRRGLPLPAVGAAVAFTVFALTMTLWSRRGDPRLLTDTPEAVLRSALGQARAGYRWALAGLAISLAAILFLVVLMTVRDPIGVQPGSVMVAGVFLALCIGFYLRHARQCRRRTRTYQAALEALDDRPPDPA